MHALTFELVINDDLKHDLIAASLKFVFENTFCKLNVCKNADPHAFDRWGIFVCLLLPINSIKIYKNKITSI